MSIVRVGQHVFSESEKERVPLLPFELSPGQRTRLLGGSQRSSTSHGSSRPCTHFRARNTANTTASTTQNSPKGKPKKIRRHHARRLLTSIGTSASSPSRMPSDLLSGTHTTLLTSRVGGLVGWPTLNAYRIAPTKPAAIATAIKVARRFCFAMYETRRRFGSSIVVSLIC